MKHTALLLTLGALSLGACLADTRSVPIEPSQGGGSSTTFHPRPGVDTSTTPGFPSVVTIQGQVYLAGTGIPTDTGVVSTAPAVPGVTVRVMHNVLRNGQATQDEMARVTSGAQGEFSVSGLPGGYYVVEGLTTSGAVAAYALVATMATPTTTSIWMPAR
jgi:hypothetical protein